jgi:formamidopyrimidine-DNA glycosylase
MPELPDVVVYCEALARRVRGEVLQRVELRSPFVLRTAVPPIASAEGKRVRDVRRLGKRIVLGLDDDLFLVIHLMVAGRLRWLDTRAKPPARITLAIFEFAGGRIVFTEAGTKRRASLHLVQGAEALIQFDRGGLEVAESTLADFAARLKQENHTLKRALTDPRLFSGIGNAYSDEILHRARLSPLMLTRKLGESDIARLFEAACGVLSEWTARLRAEAGSGFPEKVTAFHPGMAVHGRYGEPCPDCGSRVQRIVYAENECNYCARCQTGGVILADRALSRLLHDSFPRSLEEG